MSLLPVGAFSRAKLVRAVFTGAAFCAAALCAAPVARAQEILLKGPLAGAPTLLRNPPLRADRVELGLSPGASFGSNDREALLAGAQAHYFLWDGFGGGAWGTWAFPVGDGATELRAAISPELVLVPVTGKAIAFDDIYFRFDLHLFAGPGVTFTRENDDGETAWMPMGGIGFRGFCSRSWSQSLDYRVLFGDPVRHVVLLTFAYWLPLPVPEE